MQQDGRSRREKGGIDKRTCKDAYECMRSHKTYRHVHGTEGGEDTGERVKWLEQVKDAYEKDGTHTCARTNNGSAHDMKDRK